MKFRRIASLLLAVGITLSTAFTGSASTVYASENNAVAAAEIEENSTKESAKKIQSGNTVLTEIDKSEVSTDLLDDNSYDSERMEVLPEEDELVHVIIVMDGESVIEKDADAKLGFFTNLRTSYMEYKQNRVINRIEKKVLDGETLNVKYHYTWLLNGISAEVPYGMIPEIEALSGVENVILQPVYEVEKEAADTVSVADGVMIGREDTWASGYTGKGMKIAIIDTGLDDDHQNFQAMEDDCLTKDSATKESIAAVLDKLTASQSKKLTADQVYRSNKVAYGFNYADNSLTINHSSDTQGDHGTHVAGIAAANDLGNGEAVGVAPDAQLYIMKVFGKSGSGAQTENILAALEDALKLDADVINMSLGTPAGFTSESEEIDAIYGRVAETDTVLAVAAGNSTTSGLYNMWGTDTNLTSNPDNNMLSSPASYKNVTSVASIENVGIRGYYISVDGNKLSYTEGSDGPNASIETILGQELNYAMVDNFGQTAEDFTNAGVSGKVAVVQRGITPFVDKILLAQNAGAVACLIYNNTSGSFGMDLSSGTSTLPAAAISMNAGEQLKAYAEKTENPSLQFSAQQDIVPNEDAYIMSDFSSWGASSDLRLEPDVTGPGGNIYSTLDGGKYGLESGTSMASPNVAGISALIMQYAKDTNPKMSDSELHTFVNALLLSTAVPVTYDNELDYSPRNQGAGLANAYRATKSKAYLSIDTNDMPKAELFDDPDKTGNYEFTYHVNNFGDKTIYYSLDTTVQTERAQYDEETDREFMSLTPYALNGNSSETSNALIYTYDYDGNGRTDSHDARELYLQVKNETVAATGEAFRYEVDADEDTDYDDVQAYLDALVGKDSEADLKDQVLRVEAGKTADVAVSIALTKEDKAYLDTHYENGIYVEGFAKLTARSEGDVDLSMPYLGFYGDWTKAPAIDTGFYWETEEETEASQYVNLLWTTIEGSDWMPGINPYDSSEPFDITNVTVSPNGDDITETIDDIYITLLRNAKELSVSYDNAETGENYFSNAFDYVRKTYYVTSYASMFPFLYTNYAYDLYDFTDAEGNPLANNTKLTLTVEAKVDYDKHESANVFDKWEVPVTIDTEKPTVEKAEVVTEGDKQYLEVTYHDNQRTAGICFLNKRGTTILAKHAVGEGVTPGETCTKKFDITGYGNEFILVLGDYAVNEAYYKVETTDNIPNVDKNLLYGYRMHDEVDYSSNVYGWVSIDPATAAMTVLDSEGYEDAYITAAEYVDGYIFAVDSNGTLSYIIPGLWDERHEISSLGTSISTMVYDSADRVVYGYSNSDYSMVKINLLTGKAEILTPYEMSDYVRALTCDSEGNLYGINMDGKLRKINKTTGAWEEEVIVNLAYKIAKKDEYIMVTGEQSMTYEKESNSIYWAGYTNTIDSKLYCYNLTTKEFKDLGKIGDNAEITGLMKLTEKNFEIPENEAATAITLNSISVSLLEGNTAEMSVAPTPWYGVLPALTWTSVDESIATVSNTGVITGVKEGTTKVTVQNAEGTLKAECEVTVVNPKAELNAFILAANDGHRNIWMKATANDLSGMEMVGTAGMNMLYAAEYADGKIYAYNDTTEFYSIDPKTRTEQKLADANNDWSLRDMAYDYSTGFMYGIATANINPYGGTHLIKIDLMTGKIEGDEWTSLMDSSGESPIAMAISTEGKIYMITGAGNLCTYDAENNALEEIGFTGVVPTSEQLQSMTWDHVNGGIYWTYNDGTSVEKIAYVDPESGNALELGSVAGGAQMVGMYTVPTSVPKRPDVAVEGLTAVKEKVVLVEGMKTSSPVSVTPFNATNKDVTYETDQDGIITIQNNVITAVKKGTVTVTASLGDKEVKFTVQVAESAGDIRGYVMSDLSEGTGQFWASFKDSDLSTGVGLEMGDTYSLEAGEYYNGKIYGYASPTDGSSYDQQFIVIDTAEDEYSVKSFTAGTFPYVQDMAFDYSQGVMYAIAGVKNMNGYSQLYTIDLNNGSGYKVGEGYNFELKALACTTKGQLYAVDSDGNFYSIDKQSGTASKEFATGYKANKTQSMAYDHNTGNLYWAQCYSDIDKSNAALILIDPEQKSAASIGQIGMSGCQVSGMYIKPNNISVETPTLEGLKMNVNEELLAVGESAQLKVGILPQSIFLADTKIAFSSDNEAVATVDENGKVTAISAGSAKITASAGEKTAECTVNVVGDDTKIIAMNDKGWIVSPMLSPMKIDSRTTLPTDAELTILRATKASDGVFYAFGTDGYLWKFKDDFSGLEKVGEKTILESLSNLTEIDQWGGIWDSELIDITVNSFNNKVYALISVNMINYIYELDVEKGAATLVRQMAEQVSRPRTMTFIDKEKVLVYDGYNDKIYKMSLTPGEDAQSFVWAQSVVAAEDNVRMAYNQKLNRVFLATEAAYSTDESADLSMGLYILNPDNGDFKKYGNAAYDAAITGLIVQ